MIKLLFFRNRWLVCLKLCNGKSWWVQSCSLWFVKCSVNAVERAVDPLISLYIHCVYGDRLAWYIFMSLSGLQTYISSTSGPDWRSVFPPNAGFSLVVVAQCAGDFTCGYILWIYFAYFAYFMLHCENMSYVLISSDTVNCVQTTMIPPSLIKQEYRKLMFPFLFLWSPRAPLLTTSLFCTKCLPEGKKRGKHV